MTPERPMSANAEKVLLFEYIAFNGAQQIATQMAIFGKITGLDEAAVAAAYAEAEDAGMIER